MTIGDLYEQGLLNDGDRIVITVTGSGVFRSRYQGYWYQDHMIYFMDKEIVSCQWKKDFGWTFEIEKGDNDERYL